MRQGKDKLEEWKLTQERLERLRKFLPRLQEEKDRNNLTLSQVDWEQVSIQEAAGHKVVIPWPPFVYSQIVDDFVFTIEQDGWIVDDYNLEEGNRAQKDFSIIDNADVSKLKELLTYFVRGERFCDGHWKALIESGFVLKIIERLESILLQGSED